MKSIFLTMLSFGLLILFGCKAEEAEQDNTPKIGLEVTVWNATKSTPANPDEEVSPNATVYIYTSTADVDGNKPAYSGKTNANGVFAISVPVQEKYYVTAVNGNARGTKNGFLITGIFKSQQQINDSPGQTPAAKVGDLVFADTNGDGIVNDRDKISYRIFSTFGASTIITIIKDKVYISE